MFGESEQKPHVFASQEEREVATVAWDVIEREFERKIKTGIEKPRNTGDSGRRMSKHR
jgi:type III restriction enzyme